MLLCQNCSKSWGSSGTAQSDECRATVSFHFYSAKTTALCPSLPLKHPTGLLTFFLTNHEIFPFFLEWITMPEQLLQVHAAGIHPRNRAEEHCETFDKMPVVQIRLQRDLFLQQLPWAAAFVSQQLGTKCRSPKGFQLLLQSQSLQKPWKRGLDGGGVKCNSNIPCWYSFAALQSNFNGRRLKTGSSLTLGRAETERLRAGKITLYSQH